MIINQSALVENAVVRYRIPRKYKALIIKYLNTSREDPLFSALNKGISGRVRKAANQVVKTQFKQ